MTRRLPLCAWCGTSLAHKSRALWLWDAMPCAPMAGWHAERCADLDADYKRHVVQLYGGEHPDPAALLATVAARGRGRVVASRALARAKNTEPTP